MRIVVRDSSCPIDLRKASLLDVFVRLPYELLIPNTLFDGELVKFTAAQKRALVRGGLQVIDLSGESVVARSGRDPAGPRLSIHDGFAFVLAEQHAGCVLLSGDGALPTYAASCAIEVRGVLWVIDELHRRNLVPVETLLEALALFAADDTVRLLAREVAASIRRYQGLG